MRLIALFICAAALYAQTDWPVYGGNLGNTRYSPLNQIDTTNVAKLAQAWIFDSKPPAAAKDTPKKMRSMTRKDFGELLKRVITKPDPKAT